MKSVLLMAYGTPESLDDVERYYTHIRHGKKPTEKEINELREKYIRIGGTSPLKEISLRQKERLQSVLERNNSSTKVYLGMKHSRPFISDVVREAYSQGTREMLCIALAPHYSSMSVGSYIQEVKNSASGLSGLNTYFVESWHNNPFLIQAWTERVNKKVSELGNDSWVVFSAHSLPRKILDKGERYKEQLIETSRLVAIGSGIRNWSFSFQSAGHTNEEWLGPDIIEHLEELYNNGVRKFVIAPIGFVSDHLEILYDIDVECAEWARKKGVKLTRCESLNDDELFIKCLYSIVALNGFHLT